MFEIRELTPNEKRISPDMDFLIDFGNYKRHFTKAALKELVVKVNKALNL
jgi:hypothetical protein